MKKLLILILAVIVVVSGISAQNSYWEPSKGPYGGAFKLVKTNNGTLYATNIEFWQECYRSTDQGHSWQRLTFIDDVSPNDPYKTVYVGEAGTIFVGLSSLEAIKTINDGQSWDTLNNDDHIGINFIELPDGVLIGQNGSGVFRSVDGGENWTLVQEHPGTNFAAKITNTSFGGLLLEYRQGLSLTLLRSLDEGITWTTYDSQYYFTDIFITPSGTMLASKGNTAYRSTDSGISFQPIDFLLAYEPSFTALNSGRILMDDFFNNNSYSDDDGVTWHSLPSENFGKFQPITALTDGTIFKTSYNTLVRSSDGGESWQISCKGMNLGKINKFEFLSDSIYFAETGVGIWKTSNKGEDWTLLSQNNLGLKKIDAFDISPDGEIIIAQDSFIFWSTNAGDSFLDISPLHNEVSSNVFVNTNNEGLFICSHNGLERYNKQSQSWQLVLDSVGYGAFASHPSGRIVLGDNIRGLYFSDDQGVTWVNQYLTGITRFVKICTAPDGTIYIIGAEGSNRSYLWRSEDVGATWIKLPNNFLASSPSLDIASNGDLFVISENEHVLRSVNKGVTWQNVSTLVPSAYQTTHAKLNCLALSPQQRLFVGTNYFGSFASVDLVSEGSIIEGKILIDADADCSTPDDQLPFRNSLVSAQGNDFTYITNIDPFGRYIFFVDTGSYDVKVTTPNAVWWGMCDSIQIINISEYNTTDTANFSAVAISDCPLISVNVAAPSLRRCFDNEIFVQYCNQGSETADSAWVDVELDPNLSFIGSSQPHNELGNNIIRFFIGDVEFGDCGQFTLITYANCDSTILGQTHCITAHGFPDTLCTTVPNWSGANIEATVSCQDTIVQFQLHNTGPAQSQLLDYIIIEDDVVMFQGQHQYGPGGSISIPLPANGHTLRIESEQEPGHPFSTRALAFEEGCGGFETLGFINQFSVNGITPSWHTVCVENTGAYDPNDKQGFPLGTGPEHKIRPGQPIEYMIRFQNTGTDTAFTVVLRDTLSAWLDPASVLPGASSHSYTWQLSGQGELSFSFANILLPDSTTNLAASQGFVTFSIAQQPEVPLGTAIRNEAAIYFDFNEPVITNKTLHTVGVDLISSTVELPVKKKASAVQVSPNPAGELVTFRFTKGDFKGHRLQLFDPLGKAVFETKVTGNQYVLPRGQFVSGAYGWRVTDVRGRVTDSGIVIFK